MVWRMSIEYLEWRSLGGGMATCIIPELSERQLATCLSCKRMEQWKEMSKLTESVNNDQDKVGRAGAGKPLDEVHQYDLLGFGWHW
jgi:hypothetical protein